MKDVVIPDFEDPYDLLRKARAAGWHGVETIPVAGDGAFMVITLKGLVRLARNRNPHRIARRADGWGPRRSTVVAVESGNYLGAIAWKWP